MSRRPLELPPMPDLRKFVKKAAVHLRQYLRRVSVVERHIRGEGLEIGALQDPQVVPRGVKVRYLDIGTREELRARFPAKQARDLVAVDIVDDGERLGTVRDASQDFVISNHFLEHCKDPAGALVQMLRVVRPGGVVYLSVPDKSRTFDAPRPATTSAHLLEDHRRGADGPERHHVEEVVRLVEGVEEDESVSARVQELLDLDFRIHYHCWDEPAFLDFLLTLRRELQLAMRIEEFARNEAEMVVVLRKLEDAETALVRA